MFININKVKPSGDCQLFQKTLLNFFFPILYIQILKRIQNQKDT